MLRHAQHTMRDLQGGQNLLHMGSLPCGVNQLRTHVGLPCRFPKGSIAHLAFSVKTTAASETKSYIVRA